MNALAINIKDIKRAMNKDEQYSSAMEDGAYTITFGAYGRQITVLATPVEPVTEAQIEDGDYPVRYSTLVTDLDGCTDYDTMFDAIANIFMSYYQE